MAFSDLTLSKAHGWGHKQMPDSRQKTSRGICACGKWHGSMKQLWMHVKVMWSFCSLSEGFGFHFASMCNFSVWAFADATLNWCSIGPENPGRKGGEKQRDIWSINKFSPHRSRFKTPFSARAALGKISVSGQLGCTKDPSETKLKSPFERTMYM